MQGHLQLQSSVQLFDIAFAIKKFTVCGALFKRILVVIKVKIFHSCRTRVVRVALVSHPCRSCRTCVARVSIVLHSCR